MVAENRPLDGGGDRILSGALEKFQVYGIKIALRLLEDTFVRQKID